MTKQGGTFAGTHTRANPRSTICELMTKEQIVTRFWSVFQSLKSSARFLQFDFTIQPNQQTVTLFIFSALLR